MMLASVLLFPALTSADSSEASSTIRVATLDVLSGGEYSPGVDWRRFNQILIHPIQIAYTTDFRLGSPFNRSRFRPQDIERARRVFEIATEKMLGGRYPVTTTPGPNVLRIEAAIINPVSDRSQFARIGGYNMDRNPLSLVVVLRDSVNGDFLHRLALPAAQGTIGRTPRADQLWSYMRFVFTRVARAIRFAVEDGVARGRS
jgi:hypothetical protein